MPDWPTMPAPAGILSNRYRLDDIPDQHGRVAVVFGGSRGIGEATSGALAAKGAEVHIVGASPDHLEEAVAHIAEADPSAQSRVHTHSVDLGNLKQTIGLAQKLADTLPRLDMLYLIAGIGVAPFGLTTDGIGNHFGVNNLCQVAIVDVLLPLMQKTAEEKRGSNMEEEWSTRIVSESSELHRACPSDAKFATLEEMTEQSREMDPTKLYGRSKAGQILLMRHMAPMLPHGIIALAVHPGAVGTEQQKGATEAYPTPVGKAIETAGKLLFMSKEQGAESALWAGTSPAVSQRKDEVQGRYFTEADGKVDTESDQAKDKTIEQNLWNLCVKTLKDKAGYDVKLGK